VTLMDRDRVWLATLVVAPWVAIVGMLAVADGMLAAEPGTVLAGEITLGAALVVGILAKRPRLRLGAGWYGKSPSAARSGESRPTHVCR
jgi:hypothetical protein